MQEQQQTPKNSSDKPLGQERLRDHVPGYPGDSRDNNPHGPSRGGFKAAVIVGAIVLIAAIAQPFAKFMLSFTGNAATPAQHQSQTPLVIGEKEYEELGVSKGASYEDLWEAARKKQPLQFQLCSGETVLITHGMGANESATVNGVPVTPASDNFQRILIPAGATQVEITGISGGQGGKIIFVLDSFSNESLQGAGMSPNSCNLSESHNAVAVATGETVTIPITRPPI